MSELLSLLFSYCVHSLGAEPNSMAPASVLSNLKWLPLNSKINIKSQLQTSNIDVDTVQLPEKTRNSRVLILGGTGRVGGSTAIALSNLCPDLRIVVAGRNREKGEAMVAKLGGNFGFSQVDMNDENSLRNALQDVDLVVHAAGPFQKEEKCSVLEAAINTKTAYVDICDDTKYAWRAKSFMRRALGANVPAITTGGLCPGLSTIMAAELVRAALRESDQDKPESLRFSYYIAGTGGAGPAVLLGSLLLLGEEVIAYSEGEKVKLEPYSGKLNVDFEKGIGKRDVYLMNLPEVRCAYENLGVPTVSARFGSAPFFWNWGMENLTKVLPLEFLRDRSKVGRLVELFGPLIEAVDGIVGEHISMRVDLECASDRSRVAIFSHRKLSTAAGIATAAFALAILEGSTEPGVWFPDEVCIIAFTVFSFFFGVAIEAREVLLKRASQGTFNFVMNRSPWTIETNPKEHGLGIYV
ncbi:uncharacterized protein LOC107477273 [Arachis duranensis]|uniref:Uncharacterized protein LOC107477273 n=1 Tax=Arachis duranensis TaxID=130453 RepID=A0A6P4CN93_ARADU|nr:uncharacterized protein LOC107477273 [Arachis duranensis]